MALSLVSASPSVAASLGAPLGEDLSHRPLGKFTREKPPELLCWVRVGHLSNLGNFIRAVNIEKDILEFPELPHPVLHGLNIFLVN